MIFHSPLLQKCHQTLKPLFSPPKTTGGCRKPSLLVVGPPHLEEHFNRSEILRILLKDSVDKIPQSSISKFL
ncbi:hypothetical protein HKD37_01G001088 [Glycine soja]